MLSRKGKFLDGALPSFENLDVMADGTVGSSVLVSIDNSHRHARGAREAVLPSQPAAHGYNPLPRADGRNPALTICKGTGRSA